MKKILTLLISLSIASLIFAQEAKTVFTNMPDSITPLLTAINRADFIDFLESGMKAKVKNKLEGESEMTDLTDTYIRIQMTPQTTWEMKLLPLNSGDKIVSVVSTACGPVCDSSIKFFSKDWKELPATDYINLPSEDDFYKIPVQGDAFEYTELRKKADVYLLKAELDKETYKLSLAYTTPDFIGYDDKDKIQTYINSPLNYIWDGTKFVAVQGN